MAFRMRTSAIPVRHGNDQPTAAPAARNPCSIAAIRLGPGLLRVIRLGIRNPIAVTRNGDTRPGHVSELPNLGMRFAIHLQ